MTTKKQKIWQILLIGLAVLCFVLLFVGGPGPDSSRSFTYGWGLGHLFSFALWTYLYLQWRTPQPSLRLVGEVLLLAFLLGAGTELLQSEIGRDASWQDLMNDLLGSMLALTFIIPGRTKSFSRTLWLVRIPLLALVGWTLIPFLSVTLDDLVAWQQFPLLSGFETPLETSRWGGNSRRRIDHQHVFSGSSSLRVELNTQRYSGVTLKHFPADWSGYRRLRFWIFNPAAEPFPFYFRIHDQAHRLSGNRYSDRYNTSLVAPPGWSRQEILLSKVAKAPRGRPMDMTKIAGLVLFVGKLKQPHTLYLDQVELLP
ncbi:MAG: hypothetical protein GXP51_07295 [Deltaproteobacteria bacterium]|nr:hypothetical protein [Deltaproteobacteria bacterium]